MIHNKGYIVHSMRSEESKVGEKQRMEGGNWRGHISERREVQHGHKLQHMGKEHIHPSALSHAEAYPKSISNSLQKRFYLQARPGDPSLDKHLYGR